MKTYKIWSEETKQMEDITVVGLCQLAAKNAKRICSESKIREMDERAEILKTQIEVYFMNADAPITMVKCEVEKPCIGASFSVFELKERVRINYRCGYSRHNYAPCIEVLK